MNKFEVNKKYAGNKACKFPIVVIERKAQSIIYMYGTERRRSGFRTDEQGEYIYIYPFSIIPVVRACDEIKEVL